MKTLVLEQMENVQGGQQLSSEVDLIDTVDGSVAANCLYALATMVVAVGAVAIGPVGGWAVAGFMMGWLGGGVSAGVNCGKWAAGK